MTLATQLASVLIILPMLIAGCGNKKSNEEEVPAAAPGAAVPTPSVDAMATAKTIFTQRCTPCHGSSGQGDGPASASLNPKPRKYADAAWQASVTDAYIEQIIKYGGAAVGKSPAMPNNPDLNDPAVLTALKDIIRSFNTNP